MAHTPSLVRDMLYDVQTLQILAACITVLNLGDLSDARMASQERRSRSDVWMAHTFSCRDSASAGDETSD